MSGFTFPIGTTPVDCTATDAAGNTDMGSFNVTVNDNEAPTITAPANITVNNDPGQAGAVVTLPSPIVADNVPGVTGSCSPGSGFFNIGVTLVTCMATDTSGNTAQATLNVTVIDNENPTIIAPADITIGNDAGLAGASVSFSPTIDDNAPGVSVNCSPASGSFFPIGTTPVGCTATDAAGNTAFASFNVTVDDTEDPTIGVPADITVGNDPSLAGAFVSFSVTPADNAFVVSVNCTATSGSFFPVGTTTVTCTATDGAGNTGADSFTVTVEDNEDPNVVPQGHTVQLDANGNGTITAAGIDNGSTDNVGIASLTVAPTSFNCSHVGPNTVTLTAVDAAGNSNSAPATVNVEDNFPPVAIAQDLLIQLDATGNASITAPQVDNGSNDACGIASLSVSPNAFTIANLGPNTVTLTATDNNGNQSTATSTVTVGSAPIITDVLVSGTSWTRGGFSLFTDPNPGAPLPFVDLDTIQVQFAQDVDIELVSLSLTGVNVPSYTAPGGGVWFSYDNSTFVATYTFPTPFGPDRLLLNVDGESGDTAPVTPAGGGPLLDGGGGSGTDFELFVDILPGDSTRDGIVNLIDVVDVALQSLGVDPGTDTSRS